MSFPRRSLSAAFAIALAAGTVSVVTPTALAAPDGSNVVINEVYGGGGNSGSKYSHDFVELYNPTDQDIDLTGWKLDQQSAKGNRGAQVSLKGTVPAGGFFLIQGQGTPDKGAGLPTPDQVAEFNFGAKSAIAVLTSPSGEVDRVGWGGASKPEGTSAATTSNSESVQRAQVGVDTDNNAADFIVAEPTPQNSGNEAAPQPENPQPENPENPGTPQPQPGEITPIAEIQGTGAASPLEGQTVTTEGVVTAVYDEGGKNGFFLQTAGSGGAAKNPGDASDGIFVYVGGGQSFPERGASIRVTGKVSEYYNQTQLTLSAIEKLSEALEAPKATAIDTLPAGDDAREPYEGMLVRPTGAYTVTNNYTLNSTGDLGLAPGERAHRTPTDVVAPGAPATTLQKQQDLELVTLDDGRTRDYFRTDKNTPLPYILTSDNGIKSIRTGDQVQFQTDVVVDYSFDKWRFQPLQPITGKNAAEELPITWEDSRKTSYDVPDTVEGDYSIGFFNVLNYFSSLGEDEKGCKAYNDIYGAPIATNRCKVRGAFSQKAFQDQQAKIVSAINKLDTDVLGLSEIENTYSVTGNKSKRDEALQNLVDALNEKHPNKWDLVKSPQKLGTDEDVIRVAFIYQPAKVEPVGESIIFDDSAFTRTARQPLAQEFNTLGNDEDDNFVAVVNHFKSKGSVAKGDEDTGDGQGNNARLRAQQSEALLRKLNEQSQWATLPTFLVGDFNAYSKEDAIGVFEQGGFSIVESERDFDQASYQFSGQLGSLDHILANEAAQKLIKDSAVWNINGDESNSFEYSRRLYNVQDFFGDGDDPLYGYGNPFRSSDHDPVKVGFGEAAPSSESDADKHDPQVQEITVAQGDSLTDAPTAITNTDQLPEGTTFKWTTPVDTNTAGDNQTGVITVTYPDGSSETVDVVVNVKPKARYIVKAEIQDGNLVVTYDNGETENLGNVTGEQGPKGDKGDQGEKGDKGDQGDKGDTGAAGQDGANGKDGVDGQDGKNGVDGQDGKDGTNGKDGVDGKDGEQGPKGEKGEKGDKGEKGEKGDTGAAGQNGVDGKDGRGVTSFEINDEGDLVVSYTDGTSENLGKVTQDAKDGEDGEPGQPGQPGKDGANGQDGEDGANGADGQDGADGKDGKDGRGVTNAEVNENGELILTYTDGTIQNLGKVKGADGKDGLTPTTPSEDSNKRCLPAALGVSLPLLALIPLGLAAAMDIPALAPVKEQISSTIDPLPISKQDLQIAGGVAVTAAAVAAIATIAAACSTDSGSSK